MKSLTLLVLGSVVGAGAAFVFGAAGLGAAFIALGVTAISLADYARLTPALSARRSS